MKITSPEIETRQCREAGTVRAEGAPRQANRTKRQPMLRHIAPVAFLLAAMAPSALHGVGPAHGIRLSGLFSDNMVLQRGVRIPIWGTAEPRGEVTVELASQRRTARVAADGTWRVNFAPLPAGGPFELRVIGGETFTFTNVVLGEVWLCSGQSNMGVAVRHSLDASNETARAEYPQIRLFTVPNVRAYTPQTTVSKSAWRICSPATVSEFSAVAYLFGRELQQKLQVPVGLIHSSWGGTAAEAWTSGDTLQHFPPFDRAVKSLRDSAGDTNLLRRDYVREVHAWQKKVAAKDAGYATTGPQWMEPAFDDTAWPTLPVPGYWNTDGLDLFDGALWMRKTIEIPPSWAASDLELNLGPIDDEDITWFNGTRIGSNEHWNQPRTYRVPGALVKAGAAVLAIRVTDNGGSGGLWGKPEEVFLRKDAHNTLPLAGRWRYHTGVSREQIPASPVSPEDPNYPTVLYNGMIAPLIPCAIRGVAWYQGEGNALRAYQYRKLLPALIQDWRTRWQQGDFPFLIVQLANYTPVAAQPGEAWWAELREAQTMALAVTNTGLAVAIDLGEADNIHPRNKQEVGRRLALNARALVYGEKVEWSGPLFKSSRLEGGRVRITFEHASGGLVAKDGAPLKGFAIAGEDRKFSWAEAVIDGETVVVSSPAVPHPVAVRYAWATNPDCNLCNQTGLPASPFRTDEWPGLTLGAE